MKRHITILAAVVAIAAGQLNAKTAVIAAAQAQAESAVSAAPAQAEAEAAAPAQAETPTPAQTATPAQPASVIAPSPASENIPKATIAAIIQEAKMTPGADVMNLGSVATAIIRSTIKAGAIADGDADELQMLKVINGIRRISIVDFEDCSGADRRRLNARLREAFKGMDVIMEVKSDDDVLKMYGIFDERKGTVKDFILYSPEDCSLICLFGSISIDAIAKLAAE